MLGSACKACIRHSAISFGHVSLIRSVYRTSFTTASATMTTGLQSADHGVTLLGGHRGWVALGLVDMYSTDVWHSARNKAVCVLSYRMGENLMDEATQEVFPVCRENTVRAFLAAAAAGAGFIEFDVQVRCQQGQAPGTAGPRLHTPQRMQLANYAQPCFLGHMTKA